MHYWEKEGITFLPPSPQPFKLPPAYSPGVYFLVKMVQANFPTQIFRIIQRIIFLLSFFILSFAGVSPNSKYASGDAEIHRNLPMVNALLVMQHGKIVHEKYFHNFKPDSNTYIFSMT